MKRPSCHSIQPMRWGKIYQSFMLGYKPITREWHRPRNIVFFKGYGIIPNRFTNDDFRFIFIPLSYVEGTEKGKPPFFSSLHMYARMFIMLLISVSISFFLPFVVIMLEVVDESYLKSNRNDLYSCQ